MVSNAYYTLDPRLRRQAEALAAHGYQVEVLCQRESTEPPEENIRGVLVRRIGGLKYRGQSVRTYLLANADFFLRAFVALARTQIQHGYAAVQVYSMPEALLFTALLPRAVGVPLIYDAGDLTTELYTTKFGPKANRWVASLLRAQERICLRFADLIVTVHEEYRRRLLARGVPGHRLRVTMNLPDVRLIETALRTRVAADPNVFTLVHHGSLVERYGADLAVRAAARLRDRIPALRLHIYGDGDLRSRLAALIQELALGDRVTLHPGMVPLEELLPVIAAADAAIVPHRADPFTDTILPNKLLEYLALGLPTVVTRTRTVQWHIPENTVEYCTPNDVDALAGAIERLWAQPRYRASLAARARAFSQQHSWTEAAAEYCLAVDELVTSRTTAPAIPSLVQ
jgi:glycosyltransferase involved in cell wall biosynthesis